MPIQLDDSTHKLDDCLIRASNSVIISSVPCCATFRPHTLPTGTKKGHDYNAVVAFENVKHSNIMLPHAVRRVDLSSKSVPEQALLWCKDNDST